ncbi:MAG: urease accessory protein UreE [Pseudomonadota bacterium]
MIRAISVARAGAWSGEPADCVTLDYEGRFRRRLALTGDGGLSFLLDLPSATALCDGDGLTLEDGRILLVRAAAEPVADLEARDPAHLVRLAWHLGNRHLPTQILEGAPLRLRIRSDHVIEAMAEGLGAAVTRHEAPFAPEGGAYGAAGGAPHQHHDRPDHHGVDHHGLDERR